MEAAMAMNANETRRFKMLQGRTIDELYVRDYYGIENLLGVKELREDMNAYRRSTFANLPAESEGFVDRYVFEGFLQARGLLPRKWSAARLGLKVPMLDAILLRRMELPTPLRKEYVFYDCLVDASLAEDLIRALPELRYRTFYDHESFCERLHRALAASLNIPDDEMSNAKLWCATDAALGELADYPRRYALHFDCLTCEPLSAAHQIWLDFDKPLMLGPDRCSKLFYVENEELLQSHVAGAREPEGLDLYREVLHARAAGQ
jgi:hypothetical protein